MATKRKLTITFTRAALDGENVIFYRVDDATLSAIKSESTFVDRPRATNGQLPMLPQTVNLGEAEAMAYETYFNIDFNQAGLMTLTRTVNVIEIEIDINWDLSTFSSTAGANGVLK